MRRGVGWLFEFGFGGEDLAGAGDGVALIVEQALDAEGHFYVTLAVESLTGAAFVGLQLGEFGLPETQDVGGNVAEARLSGMIVGSGVTTLRIG